MSFFLNLLTIFSVIQVQWFNTDVDVTLNSEINDYLAIPQAKLYIDGKYIETDVDYTKDGVNRTFVSVIQTSYVKTYALDFEAYFPEYDERDTHTIYFHVIDDIAPTFTYLTNIEMDVGDKIPDLKSHVSYKDNYDDTDMIQLQVDSTRINPDIVGTYEIHYTLIDSSYNKTEETRYVTVVDRQAPIIKLIEPFEINYGIKTINIYEYFKITDNYDDVPSYTIDDTLVNYNVIGTYEVLITVYDQSNNKTTKTYDIFIVDNEKPQLLVPSNVEIDVYDHNQLNHLEYFILSVSDNYDQLNVDDVDIYHDINILLLGDYNIYYTVKDSSGNGQTKTIKVEVVDQIKPSIIKIEPLVFHVHSPVPIIRQYFDIFDNYDDILDIDIDTDMKMDKIGQYLLTITVKDQSKNETYYVDYIDVIDIEAPKIIQTQDIIITQFQEISYSSYIAFLDNYDETIEDFIFDDTQVNYLHVGIYDLYVIAYDQSKNESQAIIEVIVLDVIAPTITLNTEYVTLPLFSDPLNFKSYIYEVYDNYDALTIDDIKINEQVDYQTIGIYDIEYLLYDESKNVCSKKLKLRIDDFDKPIVSMKPLSVTQGESIDFLSNITVEDLSDYEIYYDQSYINEALIGTQYLTYIIKDERGNYTTYIRKIEILPHSNDFQLTDYIFNLGITILAIVLIIVIYKKDS